LSRVARPATKISRSISNSWRIKGGIRITEKILISRCLLGERVRYDAQSKACAHPLVRHWQAQGRLIGCCPEVMGGLPTPRPAAELSGGDGISVLNSRARVLDPSGVDHSAAFLRGAEAVLELAQCHAIRFALLKANSPSCSNREIYDGRFTGKLVTGIGVTTALLQEHDIQVFNEHQIDGLNTALQQ